MPSIHCGQTAILQMPKKAGKEVKLTDTLIAPSLKMAKNSVKDNGMLVYKVNKVSEINCW
jgi:hypothetical protein